MVRSLQIGAVLVVRLSIQGRRVHVLRHVVEIVLVITAFRMVTSGTVAHWMHDRVIKQIVLDVSRNMMSLLVVLRLTLARLLMLLLVGRLHCKRGLMGLIGVRVAKHVVILVCLSL